jgi:hypothetical protein
VSQTRTRRRHGGHHGARARTSRRA